MVSFLSIMYPTENILEPDKSLIPSLLKVFVMFQLRIFYDKHNEEENFVEDIAINCKIVIKTLVCI